MRLNEVINRFALVSGLEPAEVSRWTPLCIDSMNEIKTLLRKKGGLSPEDSLRLSNCAGVLAYYKYTLYAGQDVRSFTAGSVSVTTSDDVTLRAKELWEYEKNSVEDLISSDGFCFRRVSL